MPKDNIDYSNTIIYKIYCKDETIKDIYIGHTTNFVIRKYQHKTSCNNTKNDLKIYKTIRENGGWDNWNMIEIAKYNCNDSTEARIKEQQHYEELKVSLNSCPPYVDMKKYFCSSCNLQCKCSTQFNSHIKCDLHLKKLNELYIGMFPTQKSSKKFHCECCDYNTSRLSQFNRHLQTDKHKILQNPTSESFLSKIWNCPCGKQYKHSSTLYAHKKTCSYINKETDSEPENDSELTDKEIIKALINHTDKLAKIMENGVNNHSHNTNSLNKTFNLNLFLNDTCKDAMNISDFVNTIKLSLDDLEHTGRQGYVQGITNIVLKNLNNVEQHLRPLHCSDTKREVLYIKDNNEWTKETEEKPILTKAIKLIANENIKQIKNWRDKYPDCSDVDSKKNNLYLKIVSNSMNGLTKEEGDKNINKIISNVVKEVTINKT